MKILFLLLLLFLIFVLILIFLLSNKITLGIIAAIIIICLMKRAQKNSD